MGADAVHGVIGKKMKKSPEVLNFDDFVTLCSESSRNITPVVMNCHDFYNV